MDPQVLAAMIAAAGVGLSALVAFLVSRNHLRTELNRARMETRTVFLGKLYEARLRVYPGLYEILGNLGSKILTDGVTVADVRSTWAAMREWDSQNALYLSPFSVKTVIGLRKLLIAISKLSDSEFTRRRQRQELFPALVGMQMCLKTELGILHADGFHNPTRLATLREAVAQAATTEDQEGAG